jgi:hypothetical protein
MRLYGLLSIFDQHMAKFQNTEEIPWDGKIEKPTQGAACWTWVETQNHRFQVPCPKYPEIGFSPKLRSAAAWANGLSGAVSLAQAWLALGDHQHATGGKLASCASA